MSVIAIGGGKGGVGRTLVAAGLATFVAQLGKRALLVDGHPCGHPLATTFGVVRLDGTVAPWAVTDFDPRGVETVVPNLRVMAGSTELGAVPGVTLRRPREIARGAGSEYTLVDYAAGVGTTVLDGMLDADTMLLVTAPEPSAIESVYRFLRHAFVRRLSRALRARPADLEHLRKSVRDHGGPPAPIRLADEIVRGSPDLAETVWGAVAEIRARLVVNASRTRADLDLGESMTVVARQQMGVTLEYLGHVEYDESVVLAARRRRPLLVDVPAAKASRNLERIARRLVAMEAGRGERATEPATAPEALTHYEALALDRGASDEEIRRAYRRMREIYGAESLAAAGVMTESGTAGAVARVEEARDVLLDPARRRPYDLSITTADDRALAFEAEEARLSIPEAPPLPPPDLSPDTVYTGELLRALREARGVELRDVAARTKISVTNLRAMEAEDYDALPAPVYLRGFVVEVAKFLRLDVEQVTRTYLRRYRRASDEG